MPSTTNAIFCTTENLLFRPAGASPFQFIPFRRMQEPFISGADNLKTSTVLFLPPLAIRASRQKDVERKRVFRGAKRPQQRGDA